MSWHFVIWLGHLEKMELLVWQSSVLRLRFCQQGTEGVEVAGLAVLVLGKVVVWPNIFIYLYSTLLFKAGHQFQILLFFICLFLCFAILLLSNRHDFFSFFFILSSISISWQYKLNVEIITKGCCKSTIFEILTGKTVFLGLF